MNTADLFAAVQVNDISLLSLHFDVSEASPSEDAETFLNVESSGTKIDRSEDLVIGTTIVTVTSSIGDSSDSPEPNMKLEFSVGVVTTCFSSADEVDGLAATHNHVAVSAGYGFIRAHVMALAGVSPMQRLMLPEINADALERTSVGEPE